MKILKWIGENKRLFAGRLVAFLIVTVPSWFFWVLIIAAFRTLSSANEEIPFAKLFWASHGWAVVVILIIIAIIAIISGMIALGEWLKGKQFINRFFNWLWNGFKKS